MFENLTNKFEEIFSSLKKAPSLDEKQVDEGLKNIRLALLEADVSLEVVKEFINRVKPKALGQEIVRSTSPGQMVVKIVYDELVSFLGDKTSDIQLNAVPPVPIMLVGLQGSGKTTTTAKLARFLEKNNKKKVMMASLDVYRPAAQEQLRLLGEQNNISTLPVIEGQVPADICRRAISAANLNGSEVILFDTAGRTQIDFQMMNEIKQIENIINPSETILVADSLTGQVAANVAKEFKNTVNLTGIVLTRSDGDGRGGAALSMKYVADVPIKFLGVGEKIENFEIFYPDRIANRLLGMGDIVSLVEKASEDLDQENLKKPEEQLKKGQFSLEDLKIDQEFSIRYLSRTLKIGYWFWSVPLVEYMTKADKRGDWFGLLVIKVIRMLAQARANELAYKMGKREKRDILGILTRLIGESFCFAVGFIVRPFVEKRFGHWLEIYDPDIN